MTLLALQCIILSSGRVDKDYVIAEEPDLSDEFIQKIKQIIATNSTAPLMAGHVVPSVRGLRVANGALLPFELKVLEVALDEACMLLGVEVRGVVSSATARMAALQRSTVRFPGCSMRGGGRRMHVLTWQSVLQELRIHESLILEDLKEIRGESVKLQTRVNKLKRELEDILSDDQDMLDMYLQRRHIVSTAEAAAAEAVAAEAAAQIGRQSLREGTGTLSHTLQKAFASSFTRSARGSGVPGAAAAAAAAQPFQAPAAPGSMAAEGLPPSQGDGGGAGEQGPGGSPGGVRMGLVEAARAAGVLSGGAQARSEARLPWGGPSGAQSSTDQDAPVAGEAAVWTFAGFGSTLSALQTETDDSQRLEASRDPSTASQAGRCRPHTCACVWRPSRCCAVLFGLVRGARLGASCRAVCARYACMHTNVPPTARAPASARGRHASSCLTCILVPWRCCRASMVSPFTTRPQPSTSKGPPVTVSMPQPIPEMGKSQSLQKPALTPPGFGVSPDSEGDLGAGPGPPSASMLHKVTSAPEKVLIGTRIRKSSKVGQHGALAPAPSVHAWHACARSACGRAALLLGRCLLCARVERAPCPREQHARVKDENESILGQDAPASVHLLCIVCE